MNAESGASLPAASSPHSPEWPPRESGPPTLDADSGLQGLADRLAHHLLGVVSSIEGYTDLLTDTLGSPQQRELSLRILEGAAEIERLVANLRRFSQPIDPVIRLTSLQQIIDELAAVLPDAEWKRVEVKSDLPPTHGLWADPRLLRQALVVLIQNAFEAAPEGAIELAIGADDDPEGTRFCVCNEGRLMPEDIGDKVFEPFYTTKPSHLGMGLPLAQRIAESHRGTLQRASRDSDEVTCFALHLPNRDIREADLVRTSF